MKNKVQRISAVIALIVFTVFVFSVFMFPPNFGRIVRAQEKNENATPSPTPRFNARAAMAKIREEIKGREKEPAGKVFKNLKFLNNFPAENILRIMAGGFSRSLGVSCTHCHSPEDWSSDAKPAKGITRDMWAMQGKINGELLKRIEGLKGRRAIVNCTVCHRGQTKPATNMPRRQRRPRPTPAAKKETS